MPIVKVERKSSMIEITNSNGETYEKHGTFIYCDFKVVKFKTAIKKKDRGMNIEVCDDKGNIIAYEDEQ